jgi:hypothetical protein
MSGQMTGSVIAQQHNTTPSKKHAQRSSSSVTLRTFKQDTTSVATHLLPFFGDDLIDDLSEVRLEEYVSQAKAAKVSAPTINYSLRMLRKIMHEDGSALLPSICRCDASDCRGTRRNPCSTGWTPNWTLTGSRGRADGS